MPCWIWTGYRHKQGYGRLRVGGKLRLAHVWAWVQANGPVPEGMELDHLCRNPGCCNPAHLEPVTHLENVRRGNAGRLRREMTTCRFGHPLDGRTKKEGRFCLTCIRAHQHRWYLAHLSTVSKTT